MRILVVNAGSSSLKLRLLDGADVLTAEDLPATDDPEPGLARFLDGAPQPDAAGHRVVHGGPEFRESVLVDADVAGRLEALSDLAPLHNPPALAAIAALRRLRPEVPAVACFDTAFHATLPEAAGIYPVPWAWTERWGVRRYGFHGLSHAWASRRAAELVERPPGELRLVSCHLGAGASLAAVAGGRSVDTTMGFTPLEGLMMATRSGTVDPGLVLWLQRDRGLAAGDVEQALDRQSGLLGVSGVSADMREVERAAGSGNRRAALAIDLTTTACGPASPPWPPPWAASTPSCSRGAWASTLRPCGRRPASPSASWVSISTGRGTRLSPTTTPTCPPGGRGRGRSSCTPARISRSPAR